MVAVIALASVAFIVNLAWKSGEDKKQVAAGSPSIPLDNPGGSTAVFLTCTDCHSDLDKVFKEGGNRLLTYTHDMHFKKGVSDCANCHPANTHEPDKINKPTMGRCFVCHGRGKAAIAPGSCETCHPPGSSAMPVSHTQGDWLRLHPEQALADPFECATCHEQKFCQSCHGLDMPHPTDWQGQAHIQAYFTDGVSTCQNCHGFATTVQAESAETGRDFCDKCHHDWGSKDRPWIKVHPEVVKDAEAGACFKCHDPVTCATCHLHRVEDLSADRAKFNIPVAPASSASP